MYVAMTRAKQSLALITPLRFYVTQQARNGDRHVYGARSRFLTDTLLKTMTPVFHGQQVPQAGRFSPRSDKSVDVAARLHEMW